MNSFEQGVIRHLPQLRRYAHALCANASRADDLVQDTVERALRKSLLWRKPENLKAWLFSIMINIFRNDLRATRRKGTEVGMDGLDAHASHKPAQPGALALNETVRAMNGLPDNQREVLLLVAVEGMDYETCARILNIPVGTVMSRLSRARAALRVMVNGNGKPSLRRVK